MNTQKNSIGSNYYDQHIETLRSLFNADLVEVFIEHIAVDGKIFPIIDDVIVLLSESDYPAWLHSHFAVRSSNIIDSVLSKEVQKSFGDEWRAFPDILREHEAEFRDYFDLIDIETLRGNVICDLGCGIGRWSSFLASIAKSLVLVDFSEAIFVARKNLAKSTNALFFLGDLRELPFRDNFADFLFCLGVLHHLPTDCLAETRRLARYSKMNLIYLYYALDNRAIHFHFLWRASDYVRRALCKIKNEKAKLLLAWIITVAIYKPLVVIGKLFALFGLGNQIPIYEGHKNDSLKRICQDCYDRFFTPIEQRVTRKQIMGVSDTYREVIIAKTSPYWHFLCKK